MTIRRIERTLANACNSDRFNALRRSSSNFGFCMACGMAGYPLYPRICGVSALLRSTSVFSGPRVGCVVAEMHGYKVQQKTIKMQTQWPRLFPIRTLFRYAQVIGALLFVLSQLK